MLGAGARNPCCETARGDAAPNCATFHCATCRPAPRLPHSLEGPMPTMPGEREDAQANSGVGRVLGGWGLFACFLSFLRRRGPK